MLKYQEIKNLVDDEKNLPLLDKIAARFGILNFKKFVNRVGGFTLAEMLVVMLIGSIFMAASMPIITKRTKTLSDPELDDIWTYTSNKQGIYFEDKVNIGSSAEKAAQLYIASDGDANNPQIGLGNGYQDAFLRVGNYNKFVWGSGHATAGDNANNSIAIGHNAKTYVANSLAIGTNAIVDTYEADIKSAAAKQVYVQVTGYYSYTTFVSVHNRITGYTRHDHYVTHHVPAASKLLSYTNIWGQVSYSYAYYHFIQYCHYVYPSYYCDAGYYRDHWEGQYHTVHSYHYYSANRGEVLDSYRAPGAYYNHQVIVVCPSEVTVTSRTQPSISRKITPNAPSVGSTYIHLIREDNGYVPSYTTISSTALYHYDLAGRYFPNGFHVYNGACVADVYSAYSYTHALITAAHNEIIAQVDQIHQSKPSISIGHNAAARNTNTIAIGHNAYSDMPGHIMLGTSGSALYLGGSTATSSDSRLKNIKGLYNRGLKELRKLRTYLFSFKDDENNNIRAGLIAQDVQKVMPEAVAVADKKGHLAIKNEYITFAMFNAILDLDDSINALSKRQFVLERKVSKQEIRIKKLEKIVNDLKKKN